MKFLRARQFLTIQERKSLNMQFIRAAVLVSLATASILPADPMHKRVSLSNYEEAMLMKAEMLKRGVTSISFSDIQKRDAEYVRENEGWATCAGAGNAPFLTITGGGELVEFIFQETDGNFVAYEGTEAIWSSGVTGQACATTCDCLLIFQGDGNLVTVSLKNLPAPNLPFY